MFSWFQNKVLKSLLAGYYHFLYINQILMDKEVILKILLI